MGVGVGVGIGVNARLGADQNYWCTCVCEQVASTNKCPWHTNVCNLLLLPRDSIINRLLQINVNR